MRKRFASLVLIALVVGCAPVAAAPRAVEPPTATPEAPRATVVPGATPSPMPTPTPLPHVFVIVMENTSLARALRAPSIEALASRYALATGYRSVAAPSLPNYLALTSGSTHGITDDGYYALPAGGVGTQLTAAGIPWRAYMEGMTGTCMSSPYPYALKHNPFAYYGGGCPPNVVPLEALDADLASGTPSFVWITPGLCHDGHDCPVNDAGVWLDALVSRIVASDWWRARGVLFIVWDEGDGASANTVPLIVASSGVSPRRVATPYDHYSLLATLEDLFKLPRLGAAVDAKPVADLLPDWWRD